jgi:hypothetical protein
MFKELTAELLDLEATVRGDDGTHFAMVVNGCCCSSCCVCLFFCN